MSSTSDINSSIYQCQHEGCSKKFKRKGNMRIHMCRHSGIKKFTCTLGNCNKSYVNLCRLKVHIRTHVNLKNIKLFFSIFSQDTNHTRVATAIKTSTKKEIWKLILEYTQGRNLLSARSIIVNRLLRRMVS